MSTVLSPLACKLWRALHASVFWHTGFRSAAAHLGCTYAEARSAYWELERAGLSKCSACLALPIG